MLGWARCLLHSALLLSATKSYSHVAYSTKQKKKLPAQQQASA